MSRPRRKTILYRNVRLASTLGHFFRSLLGRRQLTVDRKRSDSRLTYDGLGMTDRLQAYVALPITLKERLSAEDDPALWEQVLKVLAEDASILEAVTEGSQLYAEVGVCSHWLRPHQTRWTAAGGFAWPVGYGGTRFSRTGLPLFDWSIRLQFNHAPVGWVVPEKLPAKRSISVRVAVPSRTTRHRQAAVHTVWPPKTLDAKRERSVFYGLRSLNGVWELKACSRDRERTDPT
jgi:hypothetical protein